MSQDARERKATGACTHFGEPVNQCAFHLALRNLEIGGVHGHLTMSHRDSRQGILDCTRNCRAGTCRQGLKHHWRQHDVEPLQHTSARNRGWYPIIDSPVCKLNKIADQRRRAEKEVVQQTMKGLIGLHDLDIVEGAPETPSLLPGAGGWQLLLQSCRHPSPVAMVIEVEQMNTNIEQASSQGGGSRL